MEFGIYNRRLIKELNVSYSEHLLKFPIICFHEKNRMIYFYSDYENIRKTSESLLSVWKGVKILDSQGFEFKVEKVEKTGLRGFFGWHPLFKGKSIYADYIFSQEKKNDFSELKNELINRVEKTKQFWKEAWNIQELKNAINESKTFEELITIFK